MLANLTKMLVFLTNKERNMKRPLGYEVKTLARMMKQRIDDTEFMRTNEQMTGMQGWVLGYFTRHDGEEIFQRELEAEFRVRRSTMTQLLNTMESRGLIERVECEKDRRLKKIVPTTLAREYMERSIEAINEAEAQLTQGFSQQELDTFYSFIERCKYNLGGESAQKE